MTAKKNIKALNIKVILGDNPTFDVAADVDPSPMPGDYPFVCNGIGTDDDKSLLQGILKKIIAAFPSGDLFLCVDDPDIVPDSKCPRLVAAASRKKDHAPKRTSRKSKQGASAPKRTSRKSKQSTKSGKKKGT